ncbi:hypothetical protein [Pectinatus frisingensis]|uniref:hypothetical protein n=1 Tax=Pectinatus frisingensis TaxID=865 RepID=UPI0018C6FA81|nr:hypothetical protein [Pectinatus frisingensis]
MVTVMPNEKIKIITKDRKVVIAMRGKHKGVAKCNPEDTFDVAIGLKLALERLIEQEEKGAGAVINPEYDKVKYFNIDCDGYISHSYLYENCGSSEIRVAMKNNFMTMGAAEAHKDEMVEKWKKVFAYAKTI